MQLQPKMCLKFEVDSRCISNCDGRGVQEKNNNLRKQRSMKIHNRKENLELI